MTLRERVARSMCIAAEDDPDQIVDLGLCGEGSERQPTWFRWEIYKDEADAAICAVLGWAEEKEIGSPLKHESYERAVVREFLTALKREFQNEADQKGMVSAPVPPESPAPEAK